ncbi:MAG: phosphoheptose isomerase [Bacteroidetes bacterium]|nr:phosphoheptose isomerase [Bacteroidota bacterium]
MSVEKYLEIQEKIESFGFTIVAKDMMRPWGAFLVIKEEEAQDFANRFFNGIDVDTLRVKGKLSPKILIVKPGARLSWQYHHRRAEIWQVYKGEVGIIRSNDDTEGELVKFKEGEQVRLSQGERHRLIGLEDYGIVAEIWQHTDVIPSDEEDIVRVQDDFKRN